jgi:hypothetical protein
MQLHVTDRGQGGAIGVAHLDDAAASPRLLDLGGNVEPHV